MIIGIHCGVRDGYLEALRRALSLGCEAMQMFAYPRHRDPSDQELAAFREAFSRSGLKRLVLHVRYLPSLASEDPARRGRSARLLARELSLARALGGDWLVLHLGAYSPGSDPERGMRLFADGVRAAFEESGAGVPLLVENIPGGGRRMGGSLEELARFLELLGPMPAGTGACIDTAHAWSYGYDIGGREGMSSFLVRARRLLGAGNAPVFHLNDTLAVRGSHKEDHRPWGRGCIGPEALAALLESPEHRETVGIIESPAPETDEESLAYVRSVVTAAEGR